MRESENKEQVAETSESIIPTEWTQVQLLLLLFITGHLVTAIFRSPFLHIQSTAQWNGRSW